MTDCFSLPSAAELVEQLRMAAKVCDRTNNGCQFRTSLVHAADAIEQFAKDIAEKNDILTVITNDMVPRRMFDNVCAQRDELKAERDAAVEDLKDFSDSESSCFYCRKFSSAGCTECKWEWRGVWKEEEDAD